MTEANTKANTKSDFSAAIKAAQQIQVAEQGLIQRKGELLAEMAPIRDRNLRLWRMPITKQEVLARVLADIDTQAAKFLANANWAEAFRSYAYPDVARPPNDGELNLNTTARRSHQTALNLQDIDAGVRWEVKSLLGAQAGDDLDWPRTCFFFGDLIKSKVEQHFSRLCPALVASNGSKQESPELTLQQRSAEIEVNDAQVSRLQAEVDEIDAQLDELARARGVK